LRQGLDCPISDTLPDLPDRQIERLRQPQSFAFEDAVNDVAAVLREAQTPARRKEQQPC
jgi:hypothetical protein